MNVLEEILRQPDGTLAVHDPQTLRPAQNRVPSDKERANILSITVQDKKEINALYVCIGQRTAIVKASKRAVSDVEKSIKLAKSLHFIFQRRLEASIAIEQKVATIERSMGRVGQRDEENESNRRFHDLFNIHSAELTAIRRAVEGDTKEVERATSQMRVLEQELFDARSKLQMDCKSMDIIVACYRNLFEAVVSNMQLVSAGRRLPTEILLLIFENVVQLDIDEARAQPDGPRGFSVLLLCSICIRWRELVRNAPTLWRYIPILAPAESTIYESNLEIFDLYRRHITSAGQLVFHWPAGGPWEVPGYGSEGDPIHFYRDQSLETDVLSRVPSIEVIGTRTRDGISKATCHRFMERLTMRNVVPNSLRELSSWYAIGVSAIKYLSLHARILTPTVARGIFRRFQHLVYLELQIQGGNFLQPIFTPAPSAIVSFPSLTEIATTSPILITLMTSFISAPKIRDIRIHGCVFGAPLELDTWAALVAKSELRNGDKLVFEDSPSMDCTENRFIVHLEGLVGVTYLDLRGPSLSPIVSTLASRPLLPALSILRLRDSDITEPTLRGLIEARNPIAGGSPSETSWINKLILDRCSNLTRSFCDEIKSAVDEVAIFG